MKRRFMKEKAKGYIIVEVLVAVAVLSLGILPVLYGLSAAAKAGRKREDYLYACRIIKDKISETRISSDNSNFSTMRTEGIEGKYKYDLSIEEKDDKTAACYIEVGWGKKSGGGTVGCSFFLIKDKGKYRE